MADYRKMIPFILKWEGGWSNHPNDQGGETMKGVTIATYREYCRQKKRPEPTGNDLRSITQEEWEEIFKTMYWDRWKADQIRSQAVAEILVDWVWASGVHGVRVPQRLLSVSPDGIVGPVTLAAINGADPRGLFSRIKEERIRFVEDIVKNKPSQSVFLKGWKNRINDIAFRE